MKLITLVRHGQSRSQTGEDGDHRDPELSELGLRQALTLGDRLAGADFDLIQVSPLRRARRTFELSGLAAPRVEYNSLLVEHDWGVEGFYRPLLPYEAPALARPCGRDGWLTVGERRAELLLEELLADPGDYLLLVGHWGIFSLLLQRFLGFEGHINAKRATMANGALSRLRVEDDGRRVLECWNVARLPG